MKGCVKVNLTLRLLLHSHLYVTSWIKAPKSYQLQYQSHIWTFILDAHIQNRASSRFFKFQSGFSLGFASQFLTRVRSSMQLDNTWQIQRFQNWAVSVNKNKPQNGDFFINFKKIIFTDFFKSNFKIFAFPVIFDNFTNNLGTRFSHTRLGSPSNQRAK